jgi:peptide/nickel transport system permease protein
VNVARRLRAEVQLALGLFLLVGVVGTTLLAPWISPFDPVSSNLAHIDQPPSGTHLLGTDALGRDVLSRIIHGGRQSLLIAVLGVALSVLVGTVAAVVAGLRGGGTEVVLSRAADIQLSLPAILFALMLLAFSARSTAMLVVIIGLTGWPGLYRVLRSQILSAMQQPYVEAARMLGASPVALARRHLLRRVRPFIVIEATGDIGRALMMVAGLSYLGLGVRPPTPDWGSAVAEGQAQLGYAWWTSTFPGVALVLSFLAFNLVGEWLVDRYSPTEAAR